MARLFERLHEQLGGGSWLIGRVTGSEYAKAQAYPTLATRIRPIRGNPGRAARRNSLRHRTRRPGQDRLGAVRYWRRPGRRGADRAGLRRASGGAAPGRRLHIFTGERELDLGLALEILKPRVGARTPA